MKLAIFTVIAVVIATVAGLAVWYMLYPEQKESVEVSFSADWPVEKTDNGIEIQNKFIGEVPVVGFEYNNRNYTTKEREEGLTTEIKKESFDDLLDYAENGSISQAHVIAPDGKVFAVYILIANGQPYFSEKKLIDVDSGSYNIILERESENKTIVHFRQNTTILSLLTGLIVVIVFFVALLMLWTKSENVS